MGTVWQNQVRSIACSLLSGVFLVTAIVISRRISGDADAFSSEAAACLTGAAATIIAVLCASMPELISDRLSRPQRSVLISGCGLPGVMLGLAVMPSGSSMGLACLLGLYLTAVLVATSLEPTHTDSERSNATVSSTGHLEKQISMFSDNESRSSTHSRQASDCQESDQTNSLTGRQQSVDDAGHDQSLDSRLSAMATNSDGRICSEDPLEHEATAIPFDTSTSMVHPGNRPETTQWMSRSRMGDTDIAEGAFRVHFTAGQRLAPVHLPFSPPLADTPDFECEPTDESDLRFRTTAVHAYGIRIEVSRSGDCDEEAAVDVVWSASASLKESLAA